MDWDLPEYKPDYDDSWRQPKTRRDHIQVISHEILGVNLVWKEFTTYGGPGASFTITNLEADELSLDRGRFTQFTYDEQAHHVMIKHDKRLKGVGADGFNEYNNAEIVNWLGNSTCSKWSLTGSNGGFYSLDLDFSFENPDEALHFKLTFR